MPTARGSVSRRSEAGLLVRGRRDVPHPQQVRHVDVLRIGHGEHVGLLGHVARQMDVGIAGTPPFRREVRPSLHGDIDLSRTARHRLDTGPHPPVLRPLRRDHLVRARRHVRSPRAIGVPRPPVRVRPSLALARTRLHRRDRAQRDLPVGLAVASDRHAIVTGQDLAIVSRVHPDAGRGRSSMLVTQRELDAGIGERRRDVPDGADAKIGDRDAIRVARVSREVGGGRPDEQVGSARAAAREPRARQRDGQLRPPSLAIGDLDATHVLGCCNRVVPDQHGPRRLPVEHEGELHVAIDVLQPSDVDREEPAHRARTAVDGLRPAGLTHEGERAEGVREAETDHPLDPGNRPGHVVRLLRVVRHRMAERTDARHPTPPSTAGSTRRRRARNMDASASWSGAGRTEATADSSALNAGRGARSGAGPTA